jgi:hypothetical protein
MLCAVTYVTCLLVTVRIKSISPCALITE